MKRRDTVALIFGLLLVGLALGSLWFSVTGSLDWEVLKLAIPIGLVVVGIAGLAVSRTGD
jgi:phage-related protein